MSTTFSYLCVHRDLAPKDKTGYSDPYVTVTCFEETKATSVSEIL